MQRGYDGGKKVKGTKRHLLVDTQGFVLKARVHSAKVQDLKKASRFCWTSRPHTFRASLSCVDGRRRLHRSRQRCRLGAESTRVDY